MKRIFQGTALCKILLHAIILIKVVEVRIWVIKYSARGQVCDLIYAYGDIACLLKRYALELNLGTQILAIVILLLASAWDIWDMHLVQLLVKGRLVALISLIIVCWLLPLLKIMMINLDVVER